jgi:hypothetical protein
VQLLAGCVKWTQWLAYGLISGYDNIDANRAQCPQRRRRSRKDDRPQQIIAERLGRAEIIVPLPIAFPILSIFTPFQRQGPHFRFVLRSLRILTQRAAFLFQ